MSNNQSYSDVWSQVRDVVFRQSPDCLNAFREQAFEAFCQRGLPTDRDEDFQHTDLPSRYATDYGMNVSQFNINFDPYRSFHCDVQQIQSILFFCVGGVFCSDAPQAQASLQRLAGQGVIAGSLRQVAATHPDLVARYFLKAASWKNDSTVALNSAFAQDGFFLYIPSGVVVQEPIQLISIMNADVDMLSTSHNIVVAEQGAKATLLMCSHAQKQHSYLNSQVTEVFSGNGADLQVYRLEDTNELHSQVNSLFIRQQQQSSVLVNDVTLCNGFTRNNIDARFLGEDASLSLQGFVIGDGKKHTDIHTFVDHSVPRCRTKELYKYMLGDSSTGVFDGLILVDKGAQKTEASQSNKNMVITPSARMFAKPHLEIYADDVKCSHGSAVGQIDQNAMFYMQSRGIPCAEAHMLLMLAFASDVVDNIRIEALRTRMRLLIERRFRGEGYACGSCGVCR